MQDISSLRPSSVCLRTRAGLPRPHFGALKLQGEADRPSAPRAHRCQAWGVFRGGSVGYSHCFLTPPRGISVSQPRTSLGQAMRVPGPNHGMPRGSQGRRGGVRGGDQRADRGRGGGLREGWGRPPRMKPAGLCAEALGLWRTYPIVQMKQLRPSRVKTQIQRGLIPKPAFPLPHVSSRGSGALRCGVPR